MQAIVECQRLFLISRSSRVEVFCEKRILKNFTKFPGKHLCRGLFFKRLWQKCFLVNFVKFVRTAFLIEYLWWLLL